MRCGWSPDGLDQCFGGKALEGHNLLFPMGTFLRFRRSNPPWSTILQMASLSLKTGLTPSSHISNNGDKSMVYMFPYYMILVFYTYRNWFFFFILYYRDFLSILAKSNSNFSCLYLGFWFINFFCFVYVTTSNEDCVNVIAHCKTKMFKNKLKLMQRVILYCSS